MPINQLYSFKCITIRSHTHKGQYDYAYSKASHYFKIKTLRAEPFIPCITNNYFYQPENKYLKTIYIYKNNNNNDNKKKCNLLRINSKTALTTDFFFHDHFHDFSQIFNIFMTFYKSDLFFRFFRFFMAHVNPVVAKVIVDWFSKDALTLVYLSPKKKKKKRGRKSCSQV